MGAPRRVAFAVRAFGLDRKAVLDVGCAQGEHLRHFGPGSVGLELDRSSIDRARASGLDVRPWNFVEGFSDDLAARFDAVWCSNLLEHVLSPHEFLIRARRVLVPGGLFLAVVPLTRAVAAGAWRGHLAADHVSFFTARTLRHTVERAGYAVTFLGSSSFPSAPRPVARVLGRVAPNVLVAATVVPGFDYGPRTSKVLHDDRIEFRS